MNPMTPPDGKLSRHEFRQPSYLSPSAVSMWTMCPEAYYLQYMSMDPLPRTPQTQAMAIGSAFDAIVKNRLYKLIHGDPTSAGNDPTYELKALFNAQVEVQHREWAWSEGAYLFSMYETSGAFAALVSELENSVSKPQFETEIRGQVLGRRQGVGPQRIGAPILLGKPDMYYNNRDGVRVILDWKVNGYVSERTTSPKKGYVRLYGTQMKPFANPPALIARPVIRHKDCIVREMGGMLINTVHSLDIIDDGWARQISFYAWVLGTPVAGTFISAIDQLCGPADDIRVANHRNVVNPMAQLKFYDQVCDLWYRCQTGHFYSDLSIEESDAKIEELLNNPEDTIAKAALPFFGKYQKTSGPDLLTKTMNQVGPQSETPPLFRPE